MMRYGATNHLDKQNTLYNAFSCFIKNKVKMFKGNMVAIGLEP